jgi:dTDP-4-dehydrorhamnose reductase
MMREGERMQRVLILGATGMLGHALLEALGPRFDTFATVRGHSPEDRIRGAVDAHDPASARRVLAELQPDVVVNCIGVVKQRPESADPLVSIPVNALFPHHVAGACSEVGARFIHISTDCVFSGRTGNSSETDVPDAVDLYGRSKILGEPGERHLTLRTSLLGRELHGASGLVEWFLAQSGSVRGYTRAMFSGLTTAVFARVIEDVILGHRELRGLHHVAAEPISKYELLLLLREAFGKSISIEPDPSVVIDRTLDGSRFRAATGFVAPSWREMVAGLRI